ncbi:Uncharacterised protein [Mycobacteroides abscessus subsp. abscessus]|nr:Uncharacterised protein [Mycobacteroides abscessus subsp. abscessus]
MLLPGSRAAGPSGSPAHRWDRSVVSVASAAYALSIISN